MRSFPTACVLMNRSFDHARWSRFGGRLGSFSLQRVAFVLQIVICGLHQCVNTCRSFLWRVFCKKRSLPITFQAPNPWQGCVSCIPLEIVYFFFAGQCDEERYWESAIFKLVVDRWQPWQFHHDFCKTSHGSSLTFRKKASNRSDFVPNPRWHQH